MTSLEVGFDGQNQARQSSVDVGVHDGSHRTGKVDGGVECESGGRNDEFLVTIGI